MNIKSSERMELASLALGIIAIASCACLYISIPCGALAVILANLSRGGRMQYSSRAQVAMILGIIALVLTIAIYGISIIWAFHHYGSLEGIIRAYSDMMDMNYEELMEQLYPELRPLQ